MEEEYIDVRDSQRQYERALKRFRTNPDVSNQNKEIVQLFLRAAALGKTITGRAKKKVGPAALYSYIIHLMHPIRYLKKDLDKLTDSDMEDFIHALENDIVRPKQPIVQRNILQCKKLSSRYKTNIKKTIKKFYKWSRGESKFYPPIVEWIDTYVKKERIPSLTEAEVERLVDECRTSRQRALVQVLYEGGMRIGELLNIRLHHVQLKSFDNTDPEKKIFVLGLPFSKTQTRTIGLGMQASIKWLTRWLEQHPAAPIIQKDGTLETKDPLAQLFPMTASAVRCIFKELGDRALGMRVYPHLMRHTGATHDAASGVSHYKLCKKYGWTMTSSVAQDYIDRAGVNELEIAQDTFSREEESRLKKQVHNDLLWPDT